MPTYFLSHLMNCANRDPVTSSLDLSFLPNSYDVINKRVSALINPTFDSKDQHL